MSKHHKHKTFEHETLPVAWNVVVRTDRDAPGPFVEIVINGFAVDSTEAATKAVAAKQQLLAAGHAASETADLGTAAGPAEQVPPVITTKRGRGRIVDVNPIA